MPPFEVAGWAVRAAPIREATLQVSKKRKRPSSHNQLESMEINVEKLLAQMESSRSEEPSIQNSERKKRRKANRQKPVQSDADETKDRPTTPPRKAEKKKLLKLSGDALIQARKAKPKTQIDIKTNERQTVDSAPILPLKSKPTFEELQGDSNAKLTALQKSMKDSLDGARFRSVISI